MDKKSKEPLQKKAQLALGGSLLGGFSAFVGATCCVLPLILFNLGVSSAVIAQLAFFARYKDIMLFAALVLLMMGTYFSFRENRKPTKQVLAVLAIASITIATAYILPYYEPDLLVLFGLRGT